MRLNMRFRFVSMKKFLRSKHTASKRKFLLLILCGFLALILFINYYYFASMPSSFYKFNTSAAGADEAVAEEHDENDDFIAYNAYEEVVNLPLPTSSSVLMNQQSDTNGRKEGEANGANKILQCKLLKLSPWNRKIEAFLDPNFRVNWQHDCNRTYPELTKLINGSVQVHPEALAASIHCQFRCLYPHTDYELIEGAWKEISEQPDCDIVETRCQQKKSFVARFLLWWEDPFEYHYLHAQIFKRIKQTNSDKEFKRNGATKNNQQAIRPPADVHILVIDSLSHPQFLRTMPKTVFWLLERMGAVAFSHLNKIGQNSRPNGYGLFFGLQTTPIETSLWGKGYKPPRDLDTMGNTYLDAETFVAFEYRNRSYRTMMAEDWAQGVFNWDKKVGFKQPPVDHYMRPFQLMVDAQFSPIAIAGLGQKVHDQSCKEPHHHLLQYLRDFIDAYQVEPKFSISWWSRIAHDNVNGPYRLDRDLLQFLVDYEQRLSNSFLFIMGDHGMRFGKIRETTKQGELEDNNPALFMVLPEHLRRNHRLMANLRDNARQLTTHFDVHATLVDIAKHGHAMTVDSSFDQLDPEEVKSWPSPFGQSLLYPFNKNMPRNCATLKIPFEYCLCQLQSRNVSKKEENFARQLAKQLIDELNAEIVERRANEKCAQLELKSNGKLELIAFELDEQKINLFKIIFETVPGDALFQGHIEQQQVQALGVQKVQNYTLLGERLKRLNEYGGQAFCTTDYTMAPYCYCKELLNRQPGMLTSLKMFIFSLFA